jgi:hypothetical protein
VEGVSEPGKLWCWCTACGKGSSCSVCSWATGVGLEGERDVSGRAVSAHARVDNTRVSHGRLKRSGIPRGGGFKATAGAIGTKSDSPLEAGNAGNG